MEIDEQLDEIETRIINKIVNKGLGPVTQNEMYFLIYKRLREIPLAMEEVEEESDEEGSDMLPPPTSVEESEDMNDEESDDDY